MGQEVTDLSITFRDGLAEHAQRLTEARNTPQTGSWSLMRHLPDGWVNVIHFTHPHMDKTQEYSGPVVRETDGVIVIEVHGDPVLFSKNKHLIVYRSEVES